MRITEREELQRLNEFGIFGPNQNSTVLKMNRYLKVLKLAP
jgi:hypothetical protein